MHPLDGARLKFRRGGEYVNTLHEDVARFLEGDARRIMDKYEPKAGGYIRYIVEGAPTPPEWSILLGEIAHNFRSCLDHIAWQLAIAASPAGNPKDQWKPKQIQFPIFRHRHDYRGKANRNPSRDPIWRLDGLRAEHSRAVRRCQPYLRRNAPESHPLWHLNELSNIDKHQVLHTTLVGLPPNFPPPGTFTQTLVDPQTGETEFVYGFGPPEGVEFADVSVAEVILRVGGPSHGDVYLKGNIPFQVEIDQPGTVLHEQPMLGLVDNIRDAVGSVVATFEPLL